MRILQVKRYHNEVARVKERFAIERWRERGYGYPSRSMFYFFLEDKRGYPTTLRQNGYVAFRKNKACFGMNKDKAIAVFNK